MLLGFCLNMALNIDEQWIRNKVQLKQENLDDVRSLSIPGTYHEKITKLGDSLRHFTRLKSLDLSRNSIESLEGIENLKLLVKLNLYYNNIENLSELRRLQANTKLQELDLRLNPVARNEPDYRLFLIHMLPNLRRLDDRAVRDLERKAALMHFSSDQATQMSHHPPSVLPTEQKTNPRVEHVKGLAKSPYFGGGDDEELLSQLIRTEGNFNRPVITGSNSKEISSEEYSREEIRQMNQEYLNEGRVNFPKKLSARVTFQEDDIDSSVRNSESFRTQDDDDSMQTKYPNLYPVFLASKFSGENKYPDSQATFDQTSRAEFQTSDSNLKFQDEIEAYTSYKAVGHFTPNPSPAESARLPSAQHHQSKKFQYEAEVDEGGCGVELYEQKDEIHFDTPRSYSNERYDLNEDDKMSQSLENNTDEYKDIVKAVSDLTDKYWNGSKSLVKNQKFIANFIDLLRGLKEGKPNSESDIVSITGDVGGSGDASFQMSRSVSHQREIENLRSELNRSRRENDRLHEKLVEATEAGSFIADDSNLPTDEAKLKTSLIRAHRDVAILKGRLQQTIEENKTLLEQIACLQSTTQKTPNESRPHDDKVHQENEKLKQEIQLLTIRLKQSAQMQELAAMLQDSHKSLVQTNEHLLRELNETRRRHDEEMRHLQLSYDQLKRSATTGRMADKPRNSTNGSN